MWLYYIPPDSFTLFGLEIKFYGLIMALSMLAGLLLALKICKKRGIKSDDILLLAIIVLPCAVIGARIYYCVFYEYDYTFLEFFKIWEGGLAIYGGVIGGIIGVIIFCAIKKNFKLIPILFDVLAPCLILGQAMGRWGNFFNQEAYGNLVTNENLQWFPYAVYIQDKGAWYQATFFYESVWNLIGLAILLVIYYKTKATGLTSAGYLIWQGIGRFWIEGLRSDSLYISGTNIRVSQLLSAIMIIIGVAILIYHLVKKLKKRGEHGQEV